MNPGDLLLKSAFFAAIAAAALSIPALLGKQSRGAGWAFGLHALLVIGAMGLLAQYFVGHRFEYAVVAQYSSRALSPALSLAALWAGQEGSILLWIAIAALLGIALLRQPGTLARPALFFVSLAQCAMLVLLLIKSPFRLNAVAPLDGQGLNPLLEDPWMVAHPPALFIGYAALLVPAALAAAALVRREYRDWNRMVWPWSLFAVVTLGTGIALGGIWAYKVLGWGGYWGWDPVENASLVPWLAAVALLHGLLIQRTTGAVTRTNLLLALLSWALVVGGTYLTRSGVLQDFSVHSFSDSGLNAPLTAFLVATVLVSATLLALRWRTIGGVASNWVSVSRESALWLGMVTVLVLMVLVAFGTAAPVITGLMGAPSSVQSRFYQAVSVPLGIVLLLLMAIAPALRWSRQRGSSWIVAMIPGLVAGALALGIAWAAGLRAPTQLALVALSAAALLINGIVTVRHFRRGWAYGAGYLGHAGIAVMVMGMVLSTALGRTERLTIPRGQSAQALGYTLTFQGDERDARGQRMLKVRVEKPGFTLDARPRLFPSPQGNGMVREPALANHGELYLSPMEVVPGETHAAEPTWITKGQEVVVGGVGYIFTGFRMAAEKELTVLADVHVRRGSKVETIAPGIRAGAGGSQPIEAEVAGLGSISIAKIDADRGRVALILPAGAARAPAAVVDFSTKPLINLVWIGALLAVLGSTLAGFRRARERTPLQARAVASRRERAIAAEPVPQA